MKKVCTMILSLLMIVLVVACGGGGGGGNTSKLDNSTSNSASEELTKGLDVHITYHANGGSFGGSNIKEKTLYCKTDTCPLDIGNASISSGSISVEREQFKLLGWHYAVLDESTGKPKVNEETGAYELGEAVDFKLALPAGEYHFVAAWSSLKKVIVKLAVDGENVQIPMAKPTAEKTYYVNGDEVQRTYRSDGKMQMPDFSPFEVANNAYTLIEYYKDAACTQLVNWPLLLDDAVANLPEDQNETIYAKYIEGNWQVVKTASDVQTMFEELAAENTAANRYYIFSDINCQGLSALTPLTGFKGEIQGNGRKISNLKFSKTVIANADPAVGIFGNIAATAVIKNLTLDNVKVDYKATARGAGYQVVAGLYFAFASVAAGADISSVTMSGTMTVTKQGTPTIANLACGVTPCTCNSYLYGGYENDQAYLTETQGNGFSATCTVTHP